MFVDSHCHLHLIENIKTSDDIAQLLENARKKNVFHFLCVNVRADEFETMSKLTKPFNDVYLSCGVHPLYLEEAFDFDVLSKHAEDSRVIAIGETGLDYHYSTDTKSKQQESFEQHIKLANQLNKPLVVHTRDAREDTIALLKANHADRCQGVLHCFTENWEMAKAALDLGFYISFSGIVTFKNAVELKEIAKKLPLDRILIETDSPYLAPVPFRGKTNQPEYVIHVAECIASLRQEPLSKIAQVTTKNFCDLFHI